MAENTTRDLKWSTVNRLIEKTIHSIYLNTSTYHRLKYDVVIGLMRGGLVPATCISHALNVPLLALGVKSYDGNTQADKITVYQDLPKSCLNGANILLVDDLVDTGDVMTYICNKKFKNKQIGRLHTCVLIKKQHSIFMPDYYQQVVGSNTWIKFPWEL